MNQEVVGTKKVMQGAEGWGSSEDVDMEQRPEGEREGDGLRLGRERIQEEGAGSAKALRQGLV